MVMIQLYSCSIEKCRILPPTTLSISLMQFLLNTPSKIEIKTNIFHSRTDKTEHTNIHIFYKEDKIDLKLI